MQTQSLPSEKASQWALTGYIIYAISTLGSQAMMSIGIAFALLGQWVFFGGPIGYWKKLRETGRLPSVKKYLFWSNLLNFACLVSLVGAYFYPVTYGGVTPQVKFVKDLWKCWYLYWPVLLLPGFIALSKERFTVFLRGYLGVALFICALGFIQFFTGFPTKRDIPGFPNLYHVQGLFGHHLSFASIMIFPFFLALEEAFKHLGTKGNFLRFLGVAVMFVALLGTFSRMLWLGLPIGLGLFLLLQLRGRKRWVTVVLFIVGLGLFSQIPQVRDRALNGMGTTERLTLWKINFEFFEKRPFTGVGWHHNLPLSAGWFNEHFPGETKKFVGHAHNNFIEVAAAMGIFGLIAFLGWCGNVFRLSWQLSAGLFAAWVVFHLNGLTQVNFWEAKVLHTMGLSLALLLLKGYRREFTS
jgi:O-antigen ligase